MLLSAPAGFRGTKKTLAYMRRLARRYSTHPLLRALSLKIVRQAQIKPRDYTGEARALFSYVRGRVRFTRDTQGVETLQTPVYTLRLGAGDCDDIAILLATMLLSVGHVPMFRVVDLGGGWSHVYLVDRLGSALVPLDASDTRLVFGEEVSGIRRSLMVRI